MVSLRVFYVFILTVWFISLIVIFIHISDLGYKPPVTTGRIDVDFAEETNGDHQSEAPVGLETTELKSKPSDDFEANPTSANRKEELPPQTLRCPLPESTRVHPFCQENVVRLWDHGDQLCFKKFGVDKNDDCSILSYLSEVEHWCPLLPGKNKSIKHELNPLKAEMRKDLQGLLQVLEHSHYKWMRNRISSWWSEWTKGAEAIGRKHKQRARLKKKILIFLGTFAHVPTFFYAATSGGPLGELVQWTDLIASIYLLGHDITVSASKQNLPGRLGKPDKDGCIPQKDKKSSQRYDLIFTDIVGVGIIKNVTGPLYSRHKCRLRVVDSFGTDAEFNYHGYRKPIPGGSSSWGKLDLDLRQFMTMFRKTCNFSS